MNMYCFALVVILLATLASTDAANYTALNRFLCKDFWDCKECSKIKNEGKCNTGYFSGVCYKTCTGCGPYEKDKVANCALIAKEGKCFVRETVSPFVTPATRCETSCCTGVIALPKPSKPYWSDWSYWSSCSKTCNGGNRKRTRTCHADDDSSYCIGYSTEFQQCYQKISCNKVDGGWDEWSKWSSCQTTCGLGRKYRTRSCSSPWPTVNGKPCSGTSQTFKSCYAGCCPGAGVWGTWSSWSSCSQSCSYDGSKGKQERTRKCNSPSPYCGGPPCQGDSRQTQDCGAPCLPIDGGWDEWSKWSSCRIHGSCGVGRKYRTRSCTNPSPSVNGKPCKGTSQTFKSCNLWCCAEAGDWGTWSSWSSCSQSCSYDGSKGKQERRRLCNNPAPYCGGPPCKGGSRQTQDCGAPCLPISKSVPTWSTWSNWASCSKTCSYGYRKRVRSCIVDGQENNGYCSGNKKEFEWCNKNIACPNHRW